MVFIYFSILLGLDILETLFRTRFCRHASSAMAPTSFRVNQECFPNPPRKSLGSEMPHPEGVSPSPSPSERFGETPKKTGGQRRKTRLARCDLRRETGVT